MSRNPPADVHGRPIAAYKQGDAIASPVIVIDPARGAAIVRLAAELDVSVDRVRLAIENLEARGLVEFKARFALAKPKPRGSEA